jgi:type I restriction enzyme S subunit
MELNAEKYKQTENGLIPTNWDLKKIDSIATVIRGASPRPKGDKRFYGGNIPRLMVEDVTRDGKYVTPSVDFLTEEGSKRSRPCKKGTLTIVCSGTVGIPSFLNVDACIHDGFLGIIDIRQSISNDYLYYQFVRLKEVFDKSATHGGIFTNLTTAGVKEFLVPIPKNTKEQTAIATALSDMDILIAQTVKLIEKKKAIKQGVMQELLRPKKGWNKKKISEVYKIFKGRGLSKGKLQESGENSCILYGELFTTYKEEINEIFGRTSFDEGVISVKDDILFPGSTTTTGADLAKASTLLHSGVQLGGDIIILRKFQTELDSLFVTYFLNCFRKNQITQLTKGITIHHLYGKDLSDIEIEFPEYMEQIKISNTLRTFVNELNTLENKLQKLTNQKQGMMQALLTGKIRLV